MSDHGSHGACNAEVHGPVNTQFSGHVILSTRRYEGEDEKKK